MPMQVNTLELNEIAVDERSSLRGLRCLFVAANRVAAVRERVTDLMVALARRGAVTRWFDRGVPPEAPAALGRELRCFAPTAVLCSGERAAEGLAGAGLPVIQLVVPPYDGEPSPEGPASVRLRVDGERSDEIAKLLVALATFPYDHGDPPGALAVEREAFLEYLRAIGPPALRKGRAMDEILEQADALGIPRWRSPRGWVYDRARSWTFIFDRSGRFFEADKEAHRAVRARAGHVREARSGVCCAAEPAATAPTRVLVDRRRFLVTTSLVVEGGDQERVRVFLPFPLRTDVQTEASLADASHPELEGALIVEAGYVYGAELSLRGPSTRIAVDSFVTTHEVHAHGFGPVRAPPLNPHAPRSRRIAELRACVDPYARALLLYDHFMRVGAYAKIHERCTCPPCSSRTFETQRKGHCITLTHAFIHDCAEVGLRARPVRGALFTYLRGRKFGCDVPGEPVIGHSWAEVEIDGVGWLPVDFDPLVLKAAQSRNCPDLKHRSELEEDFAYYRNFYFGNIDNQRIVYSRSSLDIPYVLAYDRSRPRGRRWTPLDSRRLRFSFEVTPL